MGREVPEMTDAYLDAVEDFTGTRGLTCPWRAFDSPLVKRVLAAYEWDRKGQLLAGVPYPSTRLIRGLAFYRRALDRALARAEENRRKRENP